MDGHDIWHSAKALLHRHGDDASIQTARTNGPQWNISVLRESSTAGKDAAKPGSEGELIWPE
jgi:hypothetical protein